MAQVKVVIRYSDGRTIKGYTNDFFPNKPSFHVASGPSDKGVEVLVSELKAVFFVRNFDGNPEYDEHRGFKEGKAVQGRKILMTFKDGEMLSGSVLGYDPNRSGFFLVPSDPGSNNIRVFVVQDAVDQLEFF
jgi:hypothetical protein